MTIFVNFFPYALKNFYNSASSMKFDKRVVCFTLVISVKTFHELDNPGFHLG